MTSAASGIRRAAALAFAREGAHVVVADVSEQANAETARLIEEHGGRALAVQCCGTAAALDYAAQNVRVNAVCPGYIDTPMMARFTGGTDTGRAKVIAEEPIGRMGRPEEIAATVVWMCSDAAGFMVGHALVVDGG